MKQNSDSSILITGGTGLIGAYAAKKLSDEGFKPICFDLKPRKIDFIPDWDLPVIKGDITKLDDLFKIVEDHSITDIIHSAAVANESVCRDDPMTSFEVNVKGTLNMAEVSRSKNLRLIYISSQAAYGNLHSQSLMPIKEEEVPHSIFGVYASHKMMGETIVQSYNQLYALDTLILRPTWVYGPGQINVQNPVSMILEKAIREQPFILEKGGDHPLPFTYVKDFAEAIFLSIKTKNPTSPVFNIDGGKIVTVKEVVAAVKKIIPNAQIEVGPGYWSTLSQQTPIRGPGDLTKARQELGYEPKYSINDGVEEFAQYLMRKQ